MTLRTDSQPSKPVSTLTSATALHTTLTVEAMATTKTKISHLILCNLIFWKLLRDCFVSALYGVQLGGDMEGGLTGYDVF
jgi:hypothetical protein